MKLTKDILKDLYRECNELYFGGVLGRCDFSLFSKMYPYLGSYCAKEDKQGKIKDKIWFGTSVKWNEELLRQVMVHEMVHMYIRRVEGHKHDGVLGHGWRFRRQARRLRKEHGIEVLRWTNVEFYNEKFYPKRWEKILLWLIDR